MRTKWVAAILAFLLGGFGAHKFYLWEKTQWFIYLLFFWTYIPAVIALVEFIVLITMSKENFNLKYNTPWKA